MAKVKVKLDRRKASQKKDGSFPIVLVINHNSKTRTISLNYSVKDDSWKDSTIEVKSITNHKRITAKIRSQLSKAEMYLINNKIEVDSMDVSELKQRIQAEILSNNNTSQRKRERFISKKLNSASIVDYSKGKLERLRESNKNGYAFAINTSLNTLKRFTGTEDILFVEIDLVFLKNFTAYCVGRGNKPNTISAYLRPIKTLFREAIQEGVIPAELNPFPKYKIPKAKNTKKRALRMEDIAKIRALQLKERSAHWDARNYFMFMFNNMGINLVDIAQLKKKQIIESKYKNGELISGRMVYTRSKNGRQYSIKLTSESIAILNKYNIAEKKDNELLFPIGYEASSSGFKRYSKKRQRINKRIRQIGEKAGIKEGITSYYARHSWATIAKRKMIPVSVIAEGLGHSDLKTTQIYLDSFDDDILDDANDSIVS
ncbi:MAG: hypothetical protein COA32_10170 [Fluviicola sp.]|nr:MAG: hypothetical protein COA32_10170 [Fluviicola sp.]